MSNINVNCCGSHCLFENGTVKKLPIGGGANLHLCHSCFVYEMNYRKERKEEAGSSNSKNWEIPSWEDLQTVWPE